MLSDEEIRDMIAAEDTKGAEDICHVLVDLANEKGGVDNITVVLVRVEELGPAAEEEN
jgi:serine/threonine protein phosphatase PrpC